MRGGHRLQLRGKRPCVSFVSSHILDPPCLSLFESIKRQMAAMRHASLVVVGRIYEMRLIRAFNRKKAQTIKGPTAHEGQSGHAVTRGGSGLTLVAVDLFVAFLSFDAVLGGRADQ